MALQFHPLPLDAFSDEARPFVARLNRELRDLFALEGTIRKPRKTRRSDLSIARRDEAQVHTSRITPDISTVVSGASTVVGTPALVFGTVNAVGSTATAVSVNSRVALFDGTLPAGVSDAGAVGSAAFAARRDHVHAHPVFSGGDYHSEYLPLTGSRVMTGELGTTVGTFRSDVASGGVGFRYNTTNDFTAGTLYRWQENAVTVMDVSHEGFFSVGGAATTTSMARVVKTLSGDSRTNLQGMNVSPTVGGTISSGGVYSPLLIGVLCTMTFNPTSIPASGAGVLEGGRFSLAYGNQGARGVNTLRGGFFQVNDNSSGASASVTALACGEFSQTGTFPGGISTTYGIKQNALTAGTVKFGGNFANRVGIASPAADAQEVLGLSQLNTGAVAGVHIKFNDKAGDPPAPVAGDLWRNGDELYLQSAARSEGLARYIPRAKWAVD